MAHRFNVSAFYSALDAVREARGLTWKHVASEAGMNASTLTRIGQGKKPDVDGLSALLVWSNLKAEMFIADAVDRGLEPLAEITKIIRMDQTLSYNSARIVEDIVKSAYNRLKSE
jgi:transcriptional regulator with XRE-family HTH domain